MCPRAGRRTQTVEAVDEPSADPTLDANATNPPVLSAPIPVPLLPTANGVDNGGQKERTSAPSPGVVPPTGPNPPATETAAGPNAKRDDRPLTLKELIDLEREFDEDRYPPFEDGDY